MAYTTSLVKVYHPKLAPAQHRPDQPTRQQRPRRAGTATRPAWRRIGCGGRRGV